MRFHSTEVGPKGPSPELGANTRDILLEIGVSQDEIEELISDGTIYENDR